MKLSALGISNGNNKEAVFSDEANTWTRVNFNKQIGKQQLSNLRMHLGMMCNSKIKVVW